MTIEEHAYAALERYQEASQALFDFVDDDGPWVEIEVSTDPADVPVEERAHSLDWMFSEFDPSKGEKTPPGNGGFTRLYTPTPAAIQREWLERPQMNSEDRGRR